MDKLFRVFLYLLLFALALLFSPIGEKAHCALFDLRSQQQPVITNYGIEEVLNTFQTIQFDI